MFKEIKAKLYETVPILIKIMCQCRNPVQNLKISIEGETSSNNILESGLQKAGVLVFDSTGRILLQQSYGNKWGLSKGAVHDLSPSVETPRSAAIRELEEETGLDLSKEDLTILTGFSLYKTKYIFYQVLIEQALKHIVPKKESTAVAWVCPICYQEKLEDQSGLKGLKAVNWASRIVLERMRKENADHVVSNRWAQVLSYVPQKAARKKKKLNSS